MNLEQARQKVLTTPYLDLPQQAKYLSKHLESPSDIRCLNTNAVISTFCTVKKPLFVFKRLGDGVIANLEISLGAKVHANYFIREGKLHPATWGKWKLRASAAIVHSLCTRAGEPVKKGFSKYDPEFIYVAHPTKTLEPNAFSMNPDECAAGIHFFLNLKDAWFY